MAGTVSRSVLALAAAVALAAGSALAETETVDGVAWSYAVSSAGAVVSGGDPLSGAVEVPSSLGGLAVAEIGYRAFSQATGMTSLVLPEGVRAVGEMACQYCTALASLSLPDGLESVGANAFRYCTALEEAVVPQSVSVVGSNAFAQCTNLAKIFLPVSWAETETAGTLGLEESCLVVYGSPGIETVRFDANGGSCGTDTADYPLGEAYGELPEATREGFAFAGWFTGEEDGTEVAESDAASCEGLRTLFAHWAAAAQAVAFEANGGSCETASAFYAAGGTYAPLPVATRARYAFLGWFTEAEGGEQILETTAVDESLSRTFFARWSLATQTVSFAANGGTCPTETADYPLGGSYGSFPEATRDGYAFDGWFADADGVTWVPPTDEVTAEETRTLFAGWSLATQTVSFAANGGHCATAEADFAVGYPYGELPEATRLGYEFSGWQDGSGNAVAATDAASGERTRTLVAVWSLPASRPALDVTGPVEVASAGTALFACTRVLSDGTKEAVSPVWTLAEGVAFGEIADDGTFTAGGTTAPRAMTLVASLDGLEAEIAFVVSADEIPWEYDLTGEGEAAVFSAGTPLPSILVVPASLDGHPVVRVDYPLAWSDGALERVVLPDTVRAIGGAAFVAATNLGSIVLPAALETIGDSAFSWCHSLAAPELPGTLRAIGECAFESCEAFDSLRLPPSVASVGRDAFRDCSKLATLYVPWTWETTGRLADAGVPEGCEIVYYGDGKTLTTPVAVPREWLDESAPAIVGANGGDYEAAALATSSNGTDAVWSCYLAGLDPEDPVSVLALSLSFDGGKASFSWSPDLGSERAYALYGKKDLSEAEPTDVTDLADPAEEGYRFFRLGVSMPSE